MIGETSTPQECTELVLENRRTTNGAAWDTFNDECYAEFSATKIELDDFGSYQTCIFKGAFKEALLFL